MHAALSEEQEALRALARDVAAGIFGGTSQVQRNIVAQRLPGLPR